MKVAVLAEQNFNLIDGSTIWLLNVCKLLGLQPDLQTHLMLTHRLENPVLAQELPESITVHDAAVTLPKAAIDDTQIRPDTLVATLSAWEANQGRFDRIFVRGTDYLTRLLADPDLRSRLVVYAPSAIPDLAEPEPRWVALARAARVPVVIQSDTGKRALESLFEYPAHVVHVVPPIVFPTQTDPQPQTGPSVLCYSGKIDLHYGMDWLMDLTRQTAQDADVAISLIAGKDTYRSRYRDFFRTMDAFRADIDSGRLPHVDIVTNVPHAQAKARMSQAHFAYCLRHDVYDDVIEISTKIVEFCTMGVPPILNDNALNRALFGADYPYLIDITEPDVAGQVVGFLRGRHSDTYRQAQARITEIAARFSAEALSDRLALAIRGYARDAARLTAAPRQIHIPTHERKFLRQFLDVVRGDGQISVGWETWASTVKPKDRPHVPDMADTVFCEWCCENAVWHSKNKRPGTKLIVRLHRFELFREFPEKVNWEAVDTLIVVSEWFRDQMVETHGVDPAKIKVIPQYIDWHGLQRPKLPEARFTVGLVGINPFEHKRFDRALDFFVRLHTRDPRFRMAVRSVMPWEIEWVWNRDDATRSKFEALFRRIYDDPRLASAIRFDPGGPDMEEWYRGVGTILSSSDTEGCHTSVFEGMASGCLPVVYNWPGAQSLFAPYVYDHMPDAIAQVIAFARNDCASARATLSQSVAEHDVGYFAQKFMAL